MAETVEVLLALEQVRQFVSGADEASRSIDRLGRETEQTGKQAQKATTRTRAFGGSVGGLARGARFAAGALGFGGLAYGLVQATKTGVSFNSQMQQSTTAFTQLLGSEEKAKLMLDELYDVAKTTPFQFTELTKSSQMLLGMGLSAEKVVPLMRDIGDAISGTGGGAQQIAQVSRALGQMQAKGRVSAEELLQLTEAGIPGLKILQEELGLSSKQVANIGKQGISADTAIAALSRGMEKRYKGMSAAQAKTFAGQMSSLKDTWAQTMGYLTEGLVSVLMVLLPIANEYLPKVKSFLQTILPYVKKFGPYLLPVVAALVAYWTVVKAIALATRLWAFAQMLLNGAFAVSPIGLVIAAAVGLVVLFVVLYKRSETFRNAMDALWATTKRVWASIVGAVKIAYAWIKRNWPLLVGILAGPFGLAAVLIYRHFARIKKFVVGVIDTIKRKLKSIPGAGVAGKALGWAGDRFATGGVSRGGLALVGERGPEIVALPSGAAVTPIQPDAALAGGSAGGFSGTVEIPLYLDKKEVARAVGRVTADQLARR